MDPDIHNSYSKHFNDNYCLSKNLINRLVEKTMETSFEGLSPTKKVRLPPPAIKQIKISKFHGILISPERYDRNIIDDAERQSDLREDSLHSISIPLDYLDPLSPIRDMLQPSNSLEESDEEDIDVPDASVMFLGSELLPEYSSLQDKAAKCNGMLDLSHLNFGNHRIAILADKLAKAGKDREVVSLCLR